MSWLSESITVFASCFTAGFVFVGWLSQMRVNNAQIAHNAAVRETLFALNGRLSSLELRVVEQLGYPDNEERDHVH